MNKLFSFQYIRIAAICFIPVIIFIVGHFTLPLQVEGVVSTGFFNGEAPYYMAIARQYFDHGFDSLFYGNPFSYLAEGQRVYFQFQSYLLGVFVKIFPLHINKIWLVFGTLFGLIFIFQSIKLFEQLGIKSERKKISQNA